jgi:hypothetical protein
MKKISVPKDDYERYVRIYWMADVLWDTSNPLPGNEDSQLNPTENRLYDAALQYHLATGELHMSKAEAAAERDKKEILRLSKRNVTFHNLKGE